MVSRSQHYSSFLQACNYQCRCTGCHSLCVRTPSSLPGNLLDSCVCWLFGRYSSVQLRMQAILLLAMGMQQQANIPANHRYHQERQQQSHEPEGGPSVSQAQPLAKRSKVKFAADDSEPHQTASDASAGTAYDASRLQQLQTGTYGSGSYSSRQQIGGEAAPAGPQHLGLLSQFKVSLLL